MLKHIKKVAVPALIFMLILTLICGFVYPMVVTGISQLAFPNQANGSIIEVDGKKYGSTLLAQEFTTDEYLWGRIMNLNTETFVDENGKPMMFSGPSNLSPASEEYAALVSARVERILAAHPEKGGEPVPSDLVTSSGSGLDPHISPAAAEYQVERIAAARDIPAGKVREVVAKYTQGRLLGIFGEPTVNVLEVNLALDGILK